MRKRVLVLIYIYSFLVLVLIYNIFVLGPCSDIFVLVLLYASSSDVILPFLYMYTGV